MSEKESCTKVIFIISRHSLRDRLKKLTTERDSLESQLKNEKDERDLYKVGESSSELKLTNATVHFD